MKLYYVSQSYNDEYDSYDAIIVAAESEDEARKTHPRASESYISKNWYLEESPDGYICSSWASLKYITAEYLGEAVAGTEKGVIMASFNAG